MSRNLDELRKRLSTGANNTGSGLSKFVQTNAQKFSSEHDEDYKEQQVPKIKTETKSRRRDPAALKERYASVTNKMRNDRSAAPKSDPLVNRRTRANAIEAIEDTEYSNLLSMMRGQQNNVQRPERTEPTDFFGRAKRRTTADPLNVAETKLRYLEGEYGVNKSMRKAAPTMEEISTDGRSLTVGEENDVAVRYFSLADQAEAGGDKELAEFYRGQASKFVSNPDIYQSYNPEEAWEHSGLVDRGDRLERSVAKAKEEVAWQTEAHKWRDVGTEAKDKGWMFDDEAYAAFKERVISEQNAASATMPDIYSVDMRAHYTPEEASNYEYLRTTAGQQAADEYANFLQPTVAARRNEVIAESTREGNFAERMLSEVVSNPLKIVNGIDVALQYLGNKITGSNMPIDVHTTGNYRVVSNTAREANTEVLDQYDAFWGFTWGDFYGLGMDIINSWVNRGFAGGSSKLAGATMMLQSSADAFVDAQERGATNDEMFIYGLITGAAEGIGETVSFDALKSGWTAYGGGKVGAKFIAALGVGAIIEYAEGGTQELVTELVSRWADEYIMGENSKYSIRVRELIADGYTPEQAADIAEEEAENELLKTFALGGASQFVSYTAGAPVVSRQERANIGRNLKELGNLEAIQEIFHDATGKSIGDNVGDAKLGREYLKFMQGAEGMIAKSMQTEDEKAVLDYYDGMRNAGETAVGTTDSKQIEAIKNALTRSVDGKRVTKKQRRLIEGDEAANATATAIRQGKVKADRQTSTERKIDVSKAKLAQYIPIEKSETLETSDAMRDRAKVVRRNMTTSDDGTTYVGGEKVASVGEFKSITADDKSATVTVTMQDGNTRDVTLDDIAFGNDINTEVIEYAAVMKTPELANSYIEASRTATVGLDRLANGMNTAYDMGKAGFRNLSTVQKSTLTRGLDASVVKAAYEMGVAARSKSIDGRIDKAAQRVAKYLGREWRPGNVRKTGIDMSNLSDIQRKNIEQVEVVAKLMGINVELFESKTNAAGKYTAKQGSYNSKTNTIRLDINAGRNEAGEHTMAETAMLRTMSHELTHAIQRNTPKQYETLRNAVLDVLEAQGENIEELVYKHLANDKSLKDRSAAIDEIVADACEMMLRDSDAIKRLADKHPDVAKSFGEKVMEFIDKLLEAIREIFGKESTTESKTLAKAMESDLKRIRDMWSEALVETSEMSGRELTSIETAMSEAMDGATDENGNELFSMRTMEEDKDIYREMLLKHGNMTAEEIDNLFRTIDALMNRINEDRLVLDFGENIDSNNRSFTPVKPNSDPLYQVSVDFSTLCRKRLLQQACQERLEAEMGRAVTKAERVAIREKLIELQQQGKQIEVACALCYVESARLKSPAQIQKFMDNREEVVRNYFARRNPATKQLMAEAEAAYRRENNLGDDSLKELGGAVAKKVRAAKNAPIAHYTMSAVEQKTADKAMSMTVSEFTTAESLWKLKAEDPVLFDIYTSYIRNATKSKGIEGDTPWKAGDSKAISDDLIEKMNEENGLRSQSWSDFQTYHILDYIGAIVELSTRNAKMQSYTKVPAYVKLMGETGMMINMSLIPEAKFDGTLRYDNVEGFIHAEAIALRDEYPNTAGTICIGISDDHIRLLLADSTIDYVIPYHKSGMDAATRRKMRIPSWHDYEKQQSEKSLGSNAGKPPKFSEWFDYDKAVADAEKANKTAEGKAAIEAGDVMYGARVAMQNAAQLYIDLCAERNLAPKFANFANEANYWKLLIDRKMINNKTGAIIKQEAVKPVFTKDTLIEICDGEVANFEQNNADFQQAVDAVVDAQRDGTLSKIAGSQKVQQIVRSHEDWVTVQAAIGVNDTQYSTRVTDTDTQHSLRDPDAISDREILANALESAVQDDEERTRLTAYKQALDKLNEAQQELDKQKDIIRGLMFKKGRTKEETMRLNQARNRAHILSEQVARADRSLLKLEAMAPIQNVLKREGDKVRAKMSALQNERISEIRASHANAATVAKIRAKALALDKILRGANKNTFVPDELRTPLAEVLKMLTYTREGENRKWNISTERNTVFGDAYGKDGLQRFERLRAAYDAIIKQDGEFAKAADPVIGEMLQKLSYAIDGRDIKALDSEGLDMVNYVLNSFKRMISEGNKLHRAVRSFTIEQATARFENETANKAYLHSKFNQSGFIKMMRDGQLTPPYFFRRLGGIFGELGNDLLKGESTYGILYGQYTKRVQDILAKYNHKKWADKKGDTLTVATKSGAEVTLTREQALSIYATHERQKRDNIHKARHLQGGGITLKIDKADLPLFRGIKKDSKSVPLELSDIKQITDWLTDEQISFANEMVKLMSGDLAKLGNQTSRILYGNSKFGEGFYFPYVVDKQFFDINLGEAGDALIKNMGFTHSLQDDATKPIVISNFTDVVTQHINSMLVYHSFAVPQDNIMRLLNHRISANETVNTLFASAYGDHMSEYLRQLMRDIYGGIGTKDPANKIVGGLIGRARKNSVMWSASVAIQQPSSVARAFAYVNPKYFVGKPTKKAYDELLKYSGTANIKAVGGFDTGNTRNFADAMRSERWAEGAVDAWNKAGSWLPGEMDKMTWTAIWEAVKREQAAKTGLGKTDEKLLDIAGERFDEVIRLTQVYDSTLSKSQNMRSDSSMMKAFTAFFGEPTLTSNMVMDAFGSEAGKGMRGRVLASVGFNILLNSLLKSLVGAARDDDDEKAKYWERYVKYLTGDFIDNLNPINYIPLVKDGWSTLLGFTVGRSDLAIADDAVDLINLILKDNKSGWDIAEASVKFFSDLSGTGVSNIWRDVKAAFNTYNSRDNRFRDGWFVNALKEGAVDTVPFLDKILPTPAEKLYLLAVDGDTAGIRKQRKYMHDYKDKDDGEINTALRGEIKDAYIAGEIDEDKAAELVDKYAPAAKKDGATYTKEWDYERIYKHPYGSMKDAYMEGKITYEQAIAARQYYGGRTYEQAKDVVDGWKAEKEGDN